MDWDWVVIAASLVIGIIGALVIRLWYRRSVHRLLAFPSRRPEDPKQACPLPVCAAHVSHDPRYFWARPAPSARFRYDCIDCRRDEPDRDVEIPGSRTAIQHDWITSGTLLDPYLDLRAAEFQIARVAQARGVSEDEVRLLVADATEKAIFKFLGAPRVDVLMLNIMLDHPPRNEPLGRHALQRGPRAFGS